MSNEKVTELPSVVDALLADIIYAVQGGISSQETLQQVFSLFLENTILHNAGNPNGLVAGVIYQLCWDTSNSVMYVCTASGSVSTAVWTVAGSFAFPLAMSLGGTSKALTASNGGLVYTDSNSMEILSGTATAGQIPRSGASSAPAWSTATYPATTTANQILYSSATNTISEITTAARGVLVTNNSSVPSLLASASTAGQVLQGSTTGAPSWSTPTYPSTSGTSGKVIVSDGTNNVYSTPTFPITSATVGKMIQSDGTNWVASTPTYPTSVGTSGKILQSNGTNYVESTPTYPSGSGTGGKLLRSDGTNNVYSTSVFADTYAINTILYNGSANTVTGLPTANSSALVTSATGVPTWVGALTNGQLIIGSTGATPVAATITGSSGITVTNGAGTITIEGGGSGYSWTEVTGTTQSMSVDNGYIANNAGLVTLTLPALSVVGDTVIVQGKGAGLFRIAQNSGQTIHIGYSDTTTGAGGSLTATNRYDSIELLCITANTDWAVLTGTQGTFTVV